MDNILIDYKVVPVDELTEAEKKADNEPFHDPDVLWRAGAWGTYYFRMTACAHTAFAAWRTPPEE